MDEEIYLLQTIRSVLKLKLEREPTNDEVSEAIKEFETIQMQVRDHIEPWVDIDFDKGFRS